MGIIERTSPGLQAIAVVGAGGFIGSHVVDAALSAGATVTAIDLVMPKCAAKPGANWLIGDVSDEAFMAASLAGCDAAVFLASRSVPSSANEQMAAEIRSHVEGSVKAAEIALSQGVKKFIFASSGGTVYGADSVTPISESAPTQPRNAYGASKLAIEHYLRIMSKLRGLQTLSLRISNPFGERQYARGLQGFIAAAMEHAFTGKALPVWGDGSTIRDFVYVGDVASAIIAACSYEGDATEINIGAGEGRSLVEAAKAVEAASNCPLTLAYEPGRNIDVAANVLDISRARQELGWQPAVGFDEALSRTAQWWRSR